MQYTRKAESYIKLENIKHHPLFQARSTAKCLRRYDLCTEQELVRKEATLYSRWLKIGVYFSFHVDSCWLVVIWEILFWLWLEKRLNFLFPGMDFILCPATWNCSKTTIRKRPNLEPLLTIKQAQYSQKVFTRENHQTKKITLTNPDIDDRHIGHQSDMLS